MLGLYPLCSWDLVGVFTNIVTYSPKLMVKATLIFGDDFKIQNSKQRERKIWFLFKELDHLNFGFVSNFDIRICL